MEKAKKGSFMSAQHASENVPDPTDNNSNIKRVPVHYEQTYSFYKNFDDLHRRIAYLKSVKNLK